MAGVLTTASVLRLQGSSVRKDRLRQRLLRRQRHQGEVLLTYPFRNSFYKAELSHYVSCRQFHQHFMYKFFEQTSYWQLFLVTLWLWGEIHAKNLRIKCWWNCCFFDQGNNFELGNNFGKNIWTNFIRGTKIDRTLKKGKNTNRGTNLSFPGLKIPVKVIK